jgi:hypothetical protein
MDCDEILMEIKMIAIEAMEIEMGEVTSQLREIIHICHTKKRWQNE